MPYPFLSDEWLEEARRIRGEHQGKDTSIPNAVRMNLVVTSVPFGDKDIDAHLDTSGSELELDTGHLENPDLTITVEYETAKAILVEGNPQAGLQAIINGRIKLDGDMTKLMALQTAPPGAGSSAAELATRLKEITE
jgi:SCP-2 sterol transfer family